MKKTIAMILLLCGALFLSVSCRKDEKTPDIEGKQWLAQPETDIYIGYRFENGVLGLGYYVLNDEQAASYKEMYGGDVKKGVMLMVPISGTYKIDRESETSGTLTMKTGSDNMQVRYENLTMDSVEMYIEGEQKVVFKTPEAYGFSVAGYVAAERWDD